MCSTWESARTILYSQQVPLGDSGGGPCVAILSHRVVIRARKVLSCLVFSSLCYCLPLVNILAPMTEVTIKIKPTTGANTFETKFTKEGTIGGLKEEVSKGCDIPADQIRLIYKGTCA